MRRTIRLLQAILPLFMALLVFSANAQQKQTVTGTVTDNANKPLQGATVEVKGQNTSTSTDTEGKFRVEVDNPASATLIFSNVGFQTAEVNLAGRTEVTFTFQAQTAALDEVVVIGYGQVRRKDLTGAVSSINSKAIRDVPVLNVNQALQGRAPGVLVQQANMRPGGGVRVNIRGISSINNGNDPIYVVDGVITQGNISELNPEDIESIDILKDASAAAIYGARGSNGVVIITTKKGRQGRFELNYDGYVGTQSNIKKLPMMNGSEYAQLRRDAEANVARQDNRAVRTDAQLFSFTRNVVGSMDYTPSTFSAKSRKTTYAHELALPFVFESGWMVMADAPEAYLKSPAKPILQKLEAAWDETKLLDGYPSEYVVMARRKGDAWFVAAINAGTERTVKVDLKKLGIRAVSVVIYTDGATGNDLTIQNLKLKNSIAELPLKANGGFVFTVNIK